MKPPSITTLLVVSCLGCLSPTAVRAQPDGGGAITPLPNGTPLQGDQFPRFLTPNHSGEFGFDNFLVLGDYPTVRFERRDAQSGSGVAVETWSRVEVSAMEGRPVSVFRPVWSSDLLEAAFRSQRWGVDQPTLLWGEVVVAGTDRPSRRDVYLQLAPPNLPSSRVVRVSDRVQYSSHAVNIVVPGFGDSRIRSGETALDLSSVTRRFYDVFVDEYDTLALVSQTALLTSHIGFRQNVQNKISGIGLPVFDESHEYGSRGALQGIEVYPPGGWATGRATLHQQSHQWGDYSAVWDQLGIVREGDDPQRHVPLLTPGAVMASAVLEATRQVDSGNSGVFRVGRTLPSVRYHPITLYRMGLIDADSLPAMRVFVDQGQFDTNDRSAPDVGTAVTGEQMPVFGSDFLAADGRRTGPVADRVRRALIYVSRTGLASQEEMDVVNFYAARLAATEGVTSWDRYPSFFGATGGRARLATDVTPRAGATSAGKIESGPAVGDLEVAVDALAGVLLDDPIPGRVGRSETLTIAGEVTATDRDDFSIACFRFIRYGSSDPNELFVCSSLAGKRFSIDVSFEANQSGSYTVEPFLFWPGSDEELPRSRYGVVIVD